MRVTWREAASIALDTAALCIEAKRKGGRRPRVDAVSCVVTRGGDVLLTETVKKDSPDAVMVFFRELLTDPDTPRAVETLSNISTMETLDDDLEPFASPPKRRRVEIASVAIRGLAVEAELARRTVDALRGIRSDDAPSQSSQAPGVSPALDSHKEEYERLRAMVGNGVPGAGQGFVARFLKNLDLRLLATIGTPLLLALLWGLWSASSSELPAQPKRGAPALPSVALKPTGPCQLPPSRSRHKGATTRLPLAARFPRTRMTSKPIPSWPRSNLLRCLTRCRWTRRRPPPCLSSAFACRPRPRLRLRPCQQHRRPRRRTRAQEPLMAVTMPPSIRGRALGWTRPCSAYPNRPRVGFPAVGRENRRAVLRGAGGYGRARGDGAPARPHGTR